MISWHPESSGSPSSLKQRHPYLLRHSHISLLTCLLQNSPCNPLGTVTRTLPWQVSLLATPETCAFAATSAWKAPLRQVVFQPREKYQTTPKRASVSLSLRTSPSQLAPGVRVYTGALCAPVSRVPVTGTVSPTTATWSPVQSPARRSVFCMNKQESIKELTSYMFLKDLELRKYQYHQASKLAPNPSWESPQILSCFL